MSSLKFFKGVGDKMLNQALEEKKRILEEKQQLWEQYHNLGKILGKFYEQKRKALWDLKEATARLNEAYYEMRRQQSFKKDTLDWQEYIKIRNRNQKKINKLMRKNIQLQKRMLKVDGSEKNGIFYKKVTGYQEEANRLLRHIDELKEEIRVAKIKAIGSSSETYQKAREVFDKAKKNLFNIMKELNKVKEMHALAKNNFLSLHEKYLKIT